MRVRPSTHGEILFDGRADIPNIITTLGAFYIMVRAVKSHKKYQAPAEAPAN